MQTTLNIDDDVYLALEKLSRRESKPTGQLLSDLLRRALGVPTPPPQISKNQPPVSFGGITPFPHRGGVVTDELINKLREGDCY